MIPVTIKPMQHSVPSYLSLTIIDLRCHTYYKCHKLISVAKFADMMGVIVLFAFDFHFVRNPTDDHKTSFLAKKTAVSKILLLRQSHCFKSHSDQIARQCSF